MHTFGFSGASLLALMSLKREQIASGRFGDDWQQHCVVGKRMSVDEFSGQTRIHYIQSGPFFVGLQGGLFMGFN